jgi:hypothetical protein
MKKKKGETGKQEEAIECTASSLLFPFKVYAIPSATAIANAVGNF